MRYCEGCGTEIGARKRYCEHCRDEAYKRQAKKRYVQHGYYKRRYDNGITYICQCCGDKVHVMSRVRRSYCDRCLESGKLGKLSHQYLMQRMPFQETHEGEEMQIDDAIRESNWIPCSERLPEDNCYTLVAVLFDEIYEVYIAAFRGDGWHTVEGYVTHWMPLPEPPEEE